MKVAHSSTTGTDAPQVTPSSTSSGAHRPIPHDLPGDPGLRAAIDRWDAYHPTLVTTGDVDDTALHLATSYVRPRPLPRRTPGATLTFRPLPPALAEQGWDNRPVVPPRPIPAPRPPSDKTGFAVAHLPRTQPHIPTAGYGIDAWTTAFGEPDGVA